MMTPGGDTASAMLAEHDQPFARVISDYLSAPGDRDLAAALLRNLIEPGELAAGADFH